MTRQISNFGAGPAKMPLEVLQRAQAEMTDFAGTGMSVLEISHRHKVYEKVHLDAQNRLKRLLSIPDAYEILFLQGGASGQFAMLPMNFLYSGRRASYVLTGTWSEKALQEASLIGTAKAAWSGKEERYRRIPSKGEIVFQEDDAYVHVTSNNTIVGSQWREFPDTGSVPLVVDASSDILSRPMDVSQFHLVYAGAQKNLGPAGVTVAIIKNDWLALARKDIPTIFRYETHGKNQSLYNTPPTFSIYMLGLVLEWADEMGGVVALEARNEQKARLIYGAIEGSNGFYQAVVQPDSFSRMNITFRLENDALEKQFLAQSEEQGFVGLAGHRSVGGCRASLYNAVTLEDCERLAQFMNEFRLQQ